MFQNDSRISKEDIVSLRFTGKLKLLNIWCYKAIGKAFRVSILSVGKAKLIMLQKIYIKKTKNLLFQMITFSRRLDKI